MIPKNVAYLSMVSSMLFVLFFKEEEKTEETGQILDNKWQEGEKVQERPDTVYLIETFGPAAEGPLEMISV